MSGISEIVSTEMNNLQTFECRLHNLKYEYPMDWAGHGLAEPGCPVCKDNENKSVSKKYILMKEQRDQLLKAIEIKTNVETESL